MNKMNEEVILKKEANINLNKTENKQNMNIILSKISKT